MANFMNLVKKYYQRTVEPQEQDAKSTRKFQYHRHPKTFGKFSNDPMKIADRPDVVGYFNDPMSLGRKPSIHVGHDVTDTGA
ncbi:hypothetical protein DM01DRAFT_1333054 [Hesseltinella vesiculosa]|uniref:Uncharacterized protein n=1 Tax=Hesseltinella vesiculosa TaxID=101127 RepID=A0A1X2GR96_9FUNG|nr:hypothetical protein DM01DRAFT_1333054 [Hesseltinella vesiculosa]